MTKTYEDGIRDAMEIVDKWSMVAIVRPAIETIMMKLHMLLPTPENDDNDD